VPDAIVGCIARLGRMVGHAECVERLHGRALLAAEDAEQDVFGADRGLTEPLGLLAGELDRTPSLDGDEDLGSAFGWGQVQLVGEVTVLSDERPAY